MRGDLPPLAASAAESVWSLGLLKGVDLVSASEKSDPTLAEAAKDRLAEHRGYHRRRAVLARLESGPDFRPAYPSDLSRDVHPAVLRLKLLPEL